MTGLTPETNYQFRIKATGAKESDWFESAEATTPAIPSGDIIGQVTPAIDSDTISWFNGGDPLPTGGYIVRYMSGGLDYGDADPVVWRVNAWGPYTYQVDHDNGGISGAPGYFGDYPSISALQSANARFGTGLTTTTNSPIGMHLSDYPYGDQNGGARANNGPGATFRLENIPAAPIVKIEATDAEAKEGDAADPAKFRISRTGNTDAALAVKLHKEAGTAEMGTSKDYTTAPGTITEVTIPANAAYVDITVTAKKDDKIEGDESIVLVLKADGTYRLNTTAYTAEAKTKDGPTVDLDVDSNNDGNVDPNNESIGTDDPIEQDNNKPGQYVDINNQDADSDGIPSFADGYAESYGGTDTGDPPLIPLLVSITESVLSPSAMLKFTYSASDPAGVIRSGSETEMSPYKFKAAPGTFRIWKVKQNRAISDYIPADTWIPLSDLGLDANKWDVKFWLEAVGPTKSADDKLMSVSIGGIGLVISDYIHIAPVGGYLNADTNHDGKIQLDGPDLTNPAEQFVFWANNNIDGYSPEEGISGTNDGYYASTVHFGNVDILDDKIGSTNYSPGALEGANSEGDAPKNDIANRDLEDFAQLRLFVTKDEYENFQKVTFKSLDGLKLRVWSSYMTGVDRAASSGYSSFAHVTDQTVSNAILSRNKSITSTNGFGSIGLDSTSQSPNWDKYSRTLTRQQFNTNFPAVAVDSNAAQTNSFTPDGYYCIPLMIEGLPSTGRLQIVFSNNNSRTIATHTICVKIADIAKMYDVYDATDGAGNMLAMPSHRTGTGTVDVSGPSSNDYTLFVHGWNNTATDKIDTGNTIFKRLYWQGYRGKLGIYAWPTDYLPAGRTGIVSLFSQQDRQNYDRSELKAYESAPGLTALLHSLKSSGKSTNILAHSMGTVVASEALRLESEKPVASREMLAANVVISQGAYTADAFDPSFSTAGPQDWLNLYASYYSEIDTVVSGSISNFFNPDDGAVASSIGWGLNQTLKPDIFFLADGTQVYYGYDQEGFFIQTDNASPTKTYINLIDDPGDKKLHSLFAFGLGARASGIGATANVGGPIVNNIDLQAEEFNFTDTRYDHSGQFYSSNLKRGSYWNKFLQVCGVTPWNT